MDEAEQIYKEIDRKDLALDLRRKLGDWSNVLQLIEEGHGDDEMMRDANNRIGQFCVDRQKWKKAAHHYKQASNWEALIDVYYRLEDFEALAGLVENIPDGSPLLVKIADKLQSVGLVEGAVKAYVKLGEIKKAIDVCVLLNQWNFAVELAEQHNFLQIEGLLQKYASHLMEKNKKMEAVELYRKANRNTESAKLLAQIAHEL